jgi:hypothetical protein
MEPWPLYLVCGRRIGQEGATDRLRPWSTKRGKDREEVERSSCPPFLRVERESPNSCLGPFVKREGSPNLQGRAKLKGRRRELNWTP